MSDDHGVNVAGSDPAAKLFPVFLLKILFCCHQNIGCRIKLEPLSGELLDDVIWHHNHRFTAQPQPFALHRSRHHRIGLSCAHHIGQQRIPAVNDPGHAVLLVFPQSNFRVHTIEMQVAPVILPWADRIEPLIIIFGQPLPALWIFPDPFLERLLDQILLSLRNSGFLSVQDWLTFPLFILHIVKHTGIPQIQRIFYDLIGIYPVCSIGVGNTGISPVHALPFDIPFPGMPGEMDFDLPLGIVRRLQQFKHKICDIRFRYPCGSQSYTDLRSGQILGLYFFQCLHIAPVCFRDFRCLLCLPQFLSHVAGKILVLRYKPGLLHALRLRQTEDHAF